MNVRVFVMGSAALLAVWLTATFFSDVPADQYPPYGKRVPASAKATDKDVSNPVAVSVPVTPPVAAIE